MLHDDLTAEGDINSTKERRRWNSEMLDNATMEILEEDSKYFLHQALSTPCLDVIESSSGSYFTTLSGRKILDFHGNNVHQLGYGNDYLVKCLNDQIQKLSFSPRRYTNQPAVELAKKLAELLPSDLNRSLFAPGGTLAVGMAMKLARVITGRYKLISNWDSFHGASLDAISAGGESVFSKYMNPLLPGVIHVPPPTTLKGIFGDSDDDQLNYAKFLEYVVEKEGDIGAFISEPIRNTDVQIPTKAYWKKIREICTRNDIVLILDEIPSALGRTGKMFTFQHYDIEPDILCLGKGLGGGLIPFAAIVTRDRFNVAQDISIGHYTHEKSPLGSIAALSVINFIEQEDILRKVVDDGTWFGTQLNVLKSQFPFIADIRGIGLLWAIELSTEESREKASLRAEKILYSCLKVGLSFKISHGNIIQLSPPLTVSRSELNKALEILFCSFKINSF